MKKLLWTLLNTVFVISAAALKPTWKYEFVSIGANSSNEDLLVVEMHLERISRGVHGISGIWDVKFDIKDDTEIECLVYRSATGSLNYKKIPYHMPRRHVYDVINGFYKIFIMKGIKTCSNLMQFKGTWKPPLEKKKYEFRKCQISIEDMPPYALEGYYKFVIKLYGEVEATGELVTKVENIVK